MTISMKPVLAALLLVSFAPAPAFAQKYGSVAAGSYGPVTYEEIDDFELKSVSSILLHPYEIVLKNAKPGKMIACQLYDSDDQPLAAKMARSTLGITRIHFTEKTENATARCFYANVERKIRPSSLPVNR